MCKRNFYFCVNNDYPQMEPNRTYNSSIVPACLGYRVYLFEDLFEDLLPSDSGFIEVSLPSSAKIINKSDREVFVDSFTFINRTEFSGSIIQWLIESGVRADAGPYQNSLVDWAVENNSISTLIYLADTCEEVRHVLNSYMNNFVTKHMYTPVIISLVKAGYNIHKNEDSLFLFAAASKNYELCKFLLEQGALISKPVFAMYTANKGMFPKMEELLEQYKNQIM